MSAGSCAVGIVGRPSLGGAGEQRCQPSPLGVDVDEQCLDEQGGGDREKCANTAQDRAPDDQGEKAEGGRQPDGGADHAGLDDALEDDVENAVDDDDGEGSLGVVIEQGDDGRRDESDDEADVGDVVGDEGQQSPQPGVTDVEDGQGDDVEERDARAEDRGYGEVPPTAVGEQLEGLGEALAGRGHPGEVGGEGGGIGDGEEQQQDEERDAAEDPGHTAEESGDDADQLSRVEGGLDGVELSLADAGGLQRIAEALHEGLELRRVVVQQSGQLQPGDHQDQNQNDHHRIHRNQTQHRAQPGRQTAPDRQPAQRLDRDRQDEREKYGGHDARERLQAECGYQHGCHADGDRQTARHHGPYRQGLGVGWTQRIHGGLRLLRWRRSGRPRRL